MILSSFIIVFFILRQTNWPPKKNILSTISKRRSFLMNHKIYFYDTKQKNRLQRFTEILKENPLNDIQTRIVNHKIYRTIRDQPYL